MGLTTSKVAVNTLFFLNQDSTQRTITFTPNAGVPAVASLTIPGNSAATQQMPTAWIGNFYSTSEGATPSPGMLGEVNFNSWLGLTFFDVSAIVNPHDHDGVKWMFPVSSKSPASGCDTFPCSNVYVLPDDLQTKSTTDKGIVVLLGNGPAFAKRELPGSERSHARDFRQPLFPRSFIETH